MKTFKRVGGAMKVGLAAMLLTACVIPESFDVAVNLDGYRYELKATGVVAVARAAAKLKQGGRLSDEDDHDLKRQEAPARQMPGFKRFNYIGNGRYEVDVDLSGTLKEPVDLIGLPNTKTRSAKENLVTIERMADGSIEVRSPTIPAKVVDELTELRIKPRSTVVITTSDHVISNNADQQSSNGDKATYRWTLDSWEKTVYLKISK